MPPLPASLPPAGLNAPLEFANGRLHLYVDYLRGRWLKTTVEVAADGKVKLQTVNRGQAATRWVERLKGKKYLQAAPTPV